MLRHRGCASLACLLTPVAPRSPRADELIRQVTINCAERGLLLLRVRDEIRMTIAAYQTLYESSIAFGMRKALMAEQKKAEMEATVRARHAAYCPALPRPGPAPSHIAAVG